MYARYIWHSPQSPVLPLTPFDKSDLTLAEAASVYSPIFVSPVFCHNVQTSISDSRKSVFITSLRPYSQSLLNPSRVSIPLQTNSLPHSTFTLCRFTFSAVLLRIRPKRDTAGGTFTRSRFQSFSIVSSLTALRAGAIRLLRPYLRGCYRITDTKVRQFFNIPNFFRKILQINLFKKVDRVFKNI